MLIVFGHIICDCMIRTVSRQVCFYYPIQTLVISIPTLFAFTTEWLLFQIQFTRINEIFLMCVPANFIKVSEASYLMCRILLLQLSTTYTLQPYQEFLEQCLFLSWGIFQSTQAHKPRHIMFCRLKLSSQPTLLTTDVFFKGYLVHQLKSCMTCLLQPKATEKSSYNKKLILQQHKHFASIL